MMRREPQYVKHARLAVEQAEMEAFYGLIGLGVLLVVVFFGAGYCAGRLS